MKDNLLMSMAISNLKKLIPSFQKDTSNTPSGQFKNLIDSVDSHFEYLKKFAEEKVRNEFDARRLCTLKNMISNDRATLCNCVKSLQDAITIGGNLYKSCLFLNKFTADIEKKS